MCGIVGLFNGRDPAPVDAALLKRMADSIAHRGPDGEGFHIAPGLGLGHRRLAIIDIARGIQPMFTADGTVAVVFNGEIYNFRELTQELQALGYVFATSSDTEVILYAWQAWCPACVTRFNGMFAFALWDSRKETLFMARDRIGKKPLYYAITDDRKLAFASEIQAVMLCPWVSRRIAPQAIEDYLSFGYVPDPKTIYSDVSKLPPGHCFTWRRGEAPVISQYWDFKLTISPAITMDEGAEHLSGLLQRAVSRRLIADVPLGAFLSGGVDSSAVVAHMAMALKTPVKTTTIGFGDDAYDERAYALALATRYGTDHVERVVAPELLTASPEMLNRLSDMYGEPFADSSAIPTYQVCAIARERVKVVLSGDGGDEAFAGYRRYLWHVREHGLRALMPGVLRRPLFGFLAAIYPQMDWAPRMFRARTTFYELSQNDVGAYFNNMAVLGTPLRHALYTDDFRKKLQGYHSSSVLKDLMAAAPADEPLMQAQYADMKTWLAGRMLVKVDRASMAHGLEVRNPFLDDEIVQWGLSLPTQLKLKGGEYKAVLKKSLEPLVPHDLLYRQKRGFSVPLASWLRGPLQPLLRQSLELSVLRDAGYFRTAPLQRLVDDHCGGRNDHSAVLWSLLMLERFLARAA